MILRLKDIMQFLKGDWICHVDGLTIAKDESEQYKNYLVESIGVQEDTLALELKPDDNE